LFPLRFFRRVARNFTNIKPTEVGLLTFSIVLNAFVFGWFVYTSVQSRSYIESTIKINARNMATSTANLLEAYADETDLILHSLADDFKEHDLLDQLNSKPVESRIREYLHWIPGGNSILVVDADGGVRWGTDYNQNSHVDLGDRDFFVAMRDDPTLTQFVGKAVIGRISQTWLVPFARRLTRRDGSFGGVVVVTVKVDFFQSILSNLDVGLKGIAILRAFDGGLIARSPATNGPMGEVGAKGYSPELAALIESGVSSGDYHAVKTSDGIERSMAYRRISYPPFRLGIGMSPDDYLTSWRKETKSRMLPLVIFLTISFLMTWLLLRMLRLNQRHQSQLSAQVARFGAIMKTSSEGIHILGIDGRLLNASESFYRMLGYDPGAPPPLNVRDWDSKFSLDELNRILQDSSNSAGCTFVTKHRMRDGTLFDVEISTHGYVIDGEAQIYCSSRDITQRLKAMKAIMESEELFRTSFESASHGMGLVGCDGRWLKVNQAMADIVGKSREAFVDALITVEGPEDLITVLNTVEHQAGEKLRMVETRLKHQDGTIVWLMLGAALVRGLDGEPKFFVVQCHDVTAQKNAIEALRAANERAEGALNAKSSFLANISHEIRTPLNAIMGLTRMVADSGAVDSEQQARLQRVLTASNALLGLLNDILDYSKGEAGRIDLVAEPFSLRASLAGSVELFADSAEQKNLDLSFEIDPDVPDLLVGDSLRLGQILNNLIGNAVKFTAKGAVGVKCEHIDTMDNGVLLRFTVTDTGIGINQDMIANLFTPFFQAEGSISRRFGGTGLGLSICRQLTVLMGGDINASSAADSGSVFRFTARFGVVLPEQLSLTSALLVDNASHCGRLQGSVLLVEDNELNQEVAENFLNKLGLEVTIAGNGVEALACMRSGRFDAVLMDLQMPVMDGFEAAKQIRRMPGGKTIPIIAMTAAVLTQDWETARAASMNDHIGKPIIREKMHAVLAKWLPKDGDGEEAALERPEPAAAPSFVPAASNPGNDSGIDLAGTIARFDGDEDLLYGLFRKFRKTNADTAKSLSALIADGKFKEAAIQAHTIKGTSGNLGITRLYDVSARLERELKADNDFSSLGEFVNVLEQALLDLAALVEQKEPQLS